MSLLTILYIGDIVGKPGREILARELPYIKSKHRIDLVLANAENSAHGLGVTRTTIEEMMDAGVDAFSSGNHVWDKKDFLNDIDDDDIPLVRPANFPLEAPGKRFLVVETNQKPVLLFNLMGRVFTGDLVDCPFKTADNILTEHDVSIYSAIIVDFHAEATSEKMALAHYLDGRVSLQVGTHTHVATADCRIFPKGMGYVTDLGMTGPYENSVIGAGADNVLHSFLTGTHIRKWETATGKALLNSVCITIDTTLRRTVAMERVDIID